MLSFDRYLEELKDFVSFSKKVELPLRDEEGEAAGYCTVKIGTYIAGVKIDEEGERFITIPQRRMDEILYELDQIR